MRAWAEGVWIAEAPLRFHGLPFGTRMTVVRLAQGGLWIHSPIALEGALAGEVAKLGAVVAVVSPNKLHHLHLESAQRAFPEARLFAPPGLAGKLAAKGRKVRFDAELGDAPDPLWAGCLDQLVVRGSPLMEEVVFFHAASRSLVVGDLCEHFGPGDPPWMRALMRLARMDGRARMPPDWQLSFRLSARARGAARASFERLLAWDFDRVILAHGALIESGARAIFEREYAWALGSAR